MDKKIRQEYQQRETSNQKIVGELKQRNSNVNWARGIVFLVGLALTIWLAYTLWPVAIACFVIFAIAFARLLRISITLKKQLAYHQQLVEINKNEQQVLDWQYDMFPEGKDFIDHEKSFLYDLDIFGAGSIFQFLNRSATQSGEAFLAGLFLHQEKEKEEIESRQLAVVELAPLLDWRQEFQASGKMVDEKATDKEKLEEWLNGEQIYQPHTWIKLAVKIVPFTGILFILLNIVGLIPASGLVLYFILTLTLVGSKIKDTNRMSNKVSKMLDLARKYAVLLKKIETADFKSKRLGLHQYTLNNETISASDKVGKLAALIHSLDNRNNMIMGVVLNALVLWDFKYMLKLEQWCLDNRKDFGQWINIISEFDAFSSLANFAYNNPQYVYADVMKGEFSLEAKESGHPLLPHKDRIGNDLSFSGKSNFIIITGANMAGKSTFLRTLGVNLLLATTGAPVCATKFSFTPTDIYTSMRTNDSLQKNESYFFAELSRLKVLIDKLQNGEELFIILDEVLKGTNSKDKRLGSIALLKQLIGLQATGIIATHDVSLGDLEEEFPENVINRRFEVEMENDELVFDYKLKEGVSQNLNATFLMKKMGITI